MKNYWKGHKGLSTENFTFKYKNGNEHTHIVEVLCDNEIGKRKILKYIPFFDEYTIQYIGEESANNIIKDEVILRTFD